MYALAASFLGSSVYLIAARYIFRTLEEAIIEEIKKSKIPEKPENKVKVKYPLFVKKNAANMFEKAGEDDIYKEKERKTRFTRVAKREKEVMEEDEIQRRMQFSMREKDSKHTLP